MITISKIETKTGRTTKADVKKALMAALDIAHAERKACIGEMAEQSQNPQVALMIEKNKGYIMAIEDMVELLYNCRVF